MIKINKLNLIGIIYILIIRGGCLDGVFRGVLSEVKWYIVLIFN